MVAALPVKAIERVFAADNKSGKGPGPILKAEWVSQRRGIYFDVNPPGYIDQLVWAKREGTLQVVNELLGGAE